MDDGLDGDFSESEFGSSVVLHLETVILVPSVELEIALSYSISDEIVIVVHRRSFCGGDKSDVGGAEFGSVGVSAESFSIF